jgi:hypothetical protein
LEIKKLWKSFRLVTGKKGDGNSGQRTQTPYTNANGFPSAPLDFFGRPTGWARSRRPQLRVAVLRFGLYGRMAASVDVAPHTFADFGLAERKLENRGMRVISFAIFAIPSTRSHLPTYIMQIQTMMLNPESLAHI